MRLKRGDLLLCYLTRLSRWVGLLEIKSEVFEDESPIFALCLARCEMTPSGDVVTVERAVKAS